ncbi:hypothetical protein AX16_010413 [Volvariella volvacea WC 439]|nr:hypothetical protein AX16_010413 [Volvariella volvacea WC 439]
MAPSKSEKAPKQKKEKIFHPSSRKAGQLARQSLRKSRMHDLAAQRTQRGHSVADIYGFWYHALPEEGVLTLDDLHQIVQEVWLTRFDEDLEAERTARRKGRPKGTKEMKLEDMKLREAEEYRTGLEVPDLTHAQNVELFRRWDQKEVAFMDLLRFIRISSTEPERVIVSRPGKHPSIIETSVREVEMVVEETQ